jgi:hypothetical protein
MADAPSAYPLAWPMGRPRTKVRRQGMFYSAKIVDVNGPYRTSMTLTLAVARKRLTGELDRLKARQPVLSMNIAFRLDGGLRSSATQNPRDPGAAVYFQSGGRPIVLACDTFTEVAQNIAAIAAHIDAMRRMERYGVGSMAQMFTGFLALPAPMVVDDWRAALGDPKTLAEAEAAFRERMKQAHPDVGGTHTEAAKLSAAMSRAREVLKS